MGRRGAGRRRLLRGLPMLLAAPSVLAQGGRPPVPVRALHSFDIQVRDVARSLRFYQALFGAPVQARQGRTVCLRVGAGPRFFSLSPLAPGAVPRITHIGLEAAEPAPGRLEAAGLRPAQAGGPPAARTFWVRERGPERGGAPEGTRELFFAGPEALVFRLGGGDHCGGAGPRGARCAAPEPVRPGSLRLGDINHLTCLTADRDGANDFHARLFGRPYQASQGPGAPLIGMGDGRQFLMFAGGGGPAAIHHACFAVEDFDVDAVLARLADHGLSPRRDPADARPMRRWVSLRMPDRGGAPGGTPELYFSDPDGVRIQLQDARYCGGGGRLGDDCPPPSRPPPRS